MSLYSLYSSFTRIMKTHYVAMLFAVVVGALSVAPMVLAPLALGDQYQGIPFFYQSDSDIYLSQLQDVYDGHLSASSPVFYEYKNTPPLVLPIGEYFYLIPSMLLGIPLVTFVTFSMFLFPAVLFLLSYTFVYKLAGRERSWASRITALAGGLMVVLGYDLVDFRTIIDGLMGGFDSLLLILWTRPINPITGGILLLSYLLIVWTLINREASKYQYHLAIGGGALLALMSGYIFSYGIALSITAVLTLILFFQRNRIALKRVALGLAVGVFPLFAQLYSVVTSTVQSGNSSLTKGGILYTHVPLINKLLVAAFIIFFLVTVLFMRREKIFPARQEVWWWFSFAILVGAFLPYIQQIITGVTIWPQHLVQYSIPLSILIGFIILIRIIQPHFKYIWASVVAVTIFLSVLYGVLAASTYTVVLDTYKDMQRPAELFNMLNNNAPQDCVVFALEGGDYLTNKIPAHTHCNVYHSSYTFFGVPQDRVVHNYMALLRFRGIGGEDITSYLRENRREVQRELFTDWKQRFAYKKDPWLQKITRDGEIEVWFTMTVRDFADQYQAFLAEDFVRILQKYRLDYVVWDRMTYPEWNAENFPFLRELYIKDGIIMYHIVENVQ